jgi:hypothetical protein
VGWQQLADIYREAAATYAAEQNERPTACPNDGEPLIEDLDGVLRCRFDGWSELDAPG